MESTFEFEFKPEEFYSRQVVLAELGRKGQEKLRHSKVSVVGLGGLGTVSTQYLALAGVGHLRIVDQDTVELNNLHRQVLYSLRNLHYPKVEAAAGRIREVNTDVTVEPIAENVRKSNVDELIRGVDCIVDGLDNMRTRYLLNRASFKHKIPYVFGAALGIEGNLSVFSPPETPCLECVLPSIDDRRLQTCDTRGVLGATTGIIGSLQAMETIKLLAGIEGSLKNKLMVCDFSDMYFTTIDILKRKDCPVCGTGRPAKPLVKEERLAVLCGSNTVNVNPAKAIRMDLDRLSRLLKDHFKILLKSAFVIVFEYQDQIEVSLFSGGRMLIKNVKNEEEAMKVYNAVFRRLGMRKAD